MAGSCSFTAGGAVRLWPVFVLGRRFSGLVAIQPGHTLVTTGIYSIIRHPSYLGLLVSSLGWGLAFRSGVGILLAVLTLVPVIGRIRAEEALLHSEFGAECDAYRGRTSRLIPGERGRGWRGGRGGRSRGEGEVRGGGGGGWVWGESRGGEVRRQSGGGRFVGGV